MLGNVLGRDLARAALMAAMLGIFAMGCSDGGGDGGEDAGSDGSTQDAGTDGSTDDGSTDDGSTDDGSTVETACTNNPCQNGGLCFSMGTTGFLCQCVGEYIGNTCADLPPAEENGWGVDGLVEYTNAIHHDRGRAVVALPDNGAIFFGSSTTVAASSIDALVVRVNANGHRVNAFDTDGAATYDFGNADEGLWAGALSPDGTLVAGVGYTGAGASRNSLLHIFDVAGNTATTTAPSIDGMFEDRLNGVTFGEAGGETYIYATGYRNTGTNTEILVARFTLEGDLDTTFDFDGYRSFDLAATGTLEQGKAIRVLADGKIVIAGDIDAAGGDADAFVVRLNADGSLDNTFGVDGDDVDEDPDGFVTVSFGVASGNVRDTVYDMDVDAMNRPVLFGSRAGVNTVSNAAGPSLPNRHRIVARITANGSGFDDTFNMAAPSNGAPFTVAGFFALAVGSVSVEARGGDVQPDGKIISSGYASMPTGVGTQSENSIILLRLNENGTTDASFGVQGVVVTNPFPAVPPTRWGMAEAYGAALRPDGTYVTVGYGRITGQASGDPVRLVSFRFAADGRRFTTDGEP